MTMNAYSTFLLEWLAGNRPPNQLPISALCNCRCLFCSNDQNPFPIARNVFRPLGDIKHQLSLMSPSFEDPIRMSDSLPGRISEGEAFLHPHFFTILDLIRTKFLKNTLCFTTNASMLDEPFIRRLAAYRPMEINISMHSTQPRLWARIFRKPERDALTALQAPSLLRQYGMHLIGTIVPLPALCGWKDIEVTYEKLVRHGARSMILYQPGYTRLTPRKRITELRCPLPDFFSFVRRMKTRRPVPLDSYPDMESALDVNIPTIMEHTRHGNRKNNGETFQHVLWLASEAAAPQLAAPIRRHARTSGNRHTLIPVPNRTYGGNIICSGLLLVDDFMAAARNALRHHPDADLLLLPVAPFDSLLCDLRGSPACTVPEALRICTWVVSNNGSFNPLLSSGFIPGAHPRLTHVRRTMEQFHRVGRDGPADGTTLTLVDAFPMKVDDKRLSRTAFRRHMQAQRRRVSSATIHAVEFLDDTHALCMETCRLAGRERHCNRWTFLVRRPSGWKITALHHGKRT
ncbi:MAG: radical SAM protein [Lentisphaerae bacterium]|nr:radical SAM protein [Lentisphaerota bacterium]